MHGRTYVDERAVLLEGNGATGTLDSYYYLLQELSTVTGLMKKNGTLVIETRRSLAAGCGAPQRGALAESQGLAEAYVYDAYGGVLPLGSWAFDRCGVLNVDARF